MILFIVQKIFHSALECHHCFEEDYILEIKDIRDGFVFLENIKSEWAVKFMKKIVTYEEIKEDA